MNWLTVSAHIEPDTESRVTVFGDQSPFVCVRISGGPVDIALMAAPGTSKAVRALAVALVEAAHVLDTMAPAVGSEVIR